VHGKQTYLNVYLRIFTNYIQLVSMTATMQLNWPPEFKELFVVQDQIGSLSDQVISLECFFKANDDVKVVFIDILLTNLLPLILCITALCFWVLWLLFHRDTNFRVNFKSTIVIMFFLVHPSIMRKNFAFFSCRELGDGEHHLIPDLSVDCWSEEHMNWIFAVALPGTIVWVLGAPALAIVALIRNRGELDNMSFRAEFGFLYSGYKSKLFFWEAFTLLRKICVACLVVFLGVAVERSLQALICFAILSVSYCLQQKYNPYMERPLNNLETNSIIVATMTIYCGLYFVSEDLSRGSQLALFTFLLTCNLYFVIYWMIKVGDKLPTVFRKKYPDLFSRFYKLRHGHSYRHEYSLAEIKPNSSSRSGDLLV